MNQLEAARERIDELDQQWVALFVERMEQIALVADYKREHGLPVKDATREHDALTMLIESVDPALRPYVEQVYRATVELSCAYQRELLGRADDEPRTLSEYTDNEPPAE